MVSAIVGKLRVAIRSAVTTFVGAALARVQLMLTVPAVVIQRSDIDEEERDQAIPVSSLGEVAMPLAKAARKAWFWLVWKEPFPRSEKLVLFSRYLL